MKIQSRQGHRLGGNKFPSSKTKVRAWKVDQTADDNTQENQGKGTTIIHATEKSKKTQIETTSAKSSQGKSSKPGQLGRRSAKSSHHHQDGGSLDIESGLDGSEREGTGDELPEERESGITDEDLKYNFFIRRLNNLLQSFPFTFNKETKKIKLNPNSAWSVVMLTTWPIFINIHLLQSSVQTLYLMYKMEDWEQEILRLSLIVMLISMVGCLKYGYSHVLSNHWNTVILVQNALVESNEFTMGTTKWTVISFIKSFWRRPFRQNFLIYLPFIIFALVFVIPMLQLADPTNPFLLSSMYYIITRGVETYWTVPKTMRFIFYTWLVLCDFLMAYFYIYTIHVGVYFILLFTHKIVEKEKIAIKQLDNYAQCGMGRALGIEKACLTFRYLHLLIHMFNECYSQAVYIVKIIAMLATIFGGFGAILAMRLAQYIFASVFGLFFIEGIVIYITLFGLAYRITDGIEGMKLAILMESAQLTGDPLVRVRHIRFVRSIPVLGITDGGFGLMDRLVTFNFTDFAFSQIIDLVITFA